MTLSRRTVRRRLREGGLTPHRPVRGLQLTPAHQQARLRFARDHLNWSLEHWRTFLFSDECKINLYDNDGRRRVYRRDGEGFAQVCIEERVAFCGGSYTVWGVIFHDGKTDIVFVSGPKQGNLTATRYIEEVLESHVMPYADFVGESFILMHDNARRQQFARTCVTSVFRSWSGQHKVWTLIPPNTFGTNSREGSGLGILKLSHSRNLKWLLKKNRTIFPKTSSKQNKIYEKTYGRSS